jgi:hypothetical protein
MALMDRPMGFSLWISDVLPNPNASWSLLDTHVDRGVLERRKQSLLTLASSRRFAVVEGTEPPAWKPML